MADAGPSNTSNALIPRPGPAPKLLEGPKVGQRSLYQQQVLDEDTYTDALSHIISRDFFPNLPHLHATNDYLTALATNDPELLSSSIRKLARIAQEKEERREGGSGQDKGKGKGRERESNDEEDARRRDWEMTGTPYISMPGRGRAGVGRTPLGARGWETPSVRGPGSTRRRPAEAEDVYDFLDGDDDESVGPSGKRQRGAAPKPAPKRVRDDLSLDAFQRNYTSEDNASFAQIVDTENERRKEERWGWAWEVERRAEARRIDGETKRKLLLDAATGGGWRVDGNGRRLIGALDEGGSDRAEGEAWKERRAITNGLAVDGTKGGERKLIGGREGGASGSGEPTGSSTALVSTSGQSSSATALVKVDAASSASALPPSRIEEQTLPSDHPLSRALVSAGLPPTALVSTEDGAIVPQAEVAGGLDGAGEGRGRGEAERQIRMEIEKRVMNDEEERAREHLAYDGTGADQWPYKMMNNLMFPPDAYTKPYPTAPRTAAAAAAAMEKIRQAPPQISHSNTRMPDEEEGGGSGSRAGSRRGSSPARSWVDAAVKGTPYRPGGGSDDMPTVDSYPLVATNPSPAPEDLPALMTWGTLLATPRALDDSGDPLDLDGPSFRMPENKRRDEIGRRLGNKASRSISDRQKGFTPRPAPSTPSLSDALRAAADRTKRGDGSVRGSMAPPSTRGVGAGGATPKRQDALTPAARSLLDRSLGRTPKVGGGGGGLGAALGASARARGAAMEKGAGWGRGTARGSGGEASGARGKPTSAMSWTPSPSHR